MKALKIPKNDRVKGLYTYCNKCKNFTTNRKCGNNQKSISSCKSKEKHVYKLLFISSTESGRIKRTKNLVTRDFEDAKKQAIDFHQELKATNFGVKQVKKQVQSKPRLLIECMAMYLGYMENKNLPEHQKRQRTRKYLKEVERVLRYFCEALVYAGYTPKSLRVDQVTQKIVGNIHEYILNKKKWSNSTYNKMMSAYNQFYNWLIENRDYQINNPFKNVVLKKQTKKKLVSLTHNEFLLLLNKISPENSLQVLSTGERKRHYFTWLKDAFRLGLETGLRREELFSLKWSSIILNDQKEPICFEVPNFKVNRKHGYVGNERQIKVVPITQGLLNLLRTQFNYDKYVGEDRYLIGGDEKSRRKSMWERASKAFSHFWSLTDNAKPANFGSLRKTFITKLYKRYGDNATIITDHSSIEVVKKHYIDDKVLSSVVRDFSVFSSTTDEKKVA